MEPGRNSLAEEQTEARYRSNLVRVRVRARARTDQGVPQTSAPRLHPGCSPTQAAPRLQPRAPPIAVPAPPPGIYRAMPRYLSPQARYRSLYEERLNPFAAFHKKERMQRINELHAAERLVRNSSSEP